VPVHLRSAQVGEGRAIRQDEQVRAGRTYVDWSDGIDKELD